MLETIIRSFRNRWNNKPFGYPGDDKTTYNFHLVDVWVQTAECANIEEIVAFEVRQPLLINITIGQALIVQVDDRLMFWLGSNQG